MIWKAIVFFLMGLAPNFRKKFSSLLLSDSFIIIYYSMKIKIYHHGTNVFSCLSLNPIDCFFFQKVFIIRLNNGMGEGIALRQRVCDAKNPNWPPRQNGQKRQPAKCSNIEYELKKAKHLNHQHRQKSQFTTIKERLLKVKCSRFWNYRVSL